LHIVSQQAWNLIIFVKTVLYTRKKKQESKVRLQKIPFFFNHEIQYKTDSLKKVFLTFGYCLK